MLSTQQTNKQSLTDLVKESKDALFALSNEEFVKTIQEVIPESLLMKGTANVSAEIRQEAKTTKNIYGLSEDEEIRAFAGLWLFKTVMNGTKDDTLTKENNADYKSFIACQEEMKKPVLSYESFQEIGKYIRDTLLTPEDYAAAMWSILCNDLGKVHSVIEAYKNAFPDAKKIGHDGLLAAFLKGKPEGFAGFMNLTPEHRQQIIAGYASGCDFSMFEQLELPSVSLAALKALDQKSLALYLLHTVFDVAGAAAHFKANGSLTMHQETWDFFNAACKSLENLQSCSPEDAYKNYLQYRGQRIGIENDSAEATALIRIAGLARLATPAQGTMLRSVWESLPEATKSILKKELNVTGSDGESAIFIGYGVAMLLNAQGGLQKALTEAAKINGTPVSAEQRAAANHEGLSIGLTVMAKVYAKTRELLGPSNQHKVFVAECDDIAKLLNKDPRATLSMDLLAVSADDRRIDFKLENRPVNANDNPTLLPEGTKLSTNPNAKFTPAPTSIVKNESNNLVVTQSARL